MASSGKSAAIIHTSDGDQRNAPDSELPTPTRYEEGQPGSHKANDTKDERSIANKLAAAKDNTTNNRKAGKEDNPDLPSEGDTPTSLARNHGNEPSKGAKIDEALEAEDQAILRKKGILKD